MVILPYGNNTMIMPTRKERKIILSWNLMTLALYEIPFSNPK